MTETRPLKILFGITKSNFGGAQRYVYDMAVAAKARGADVHVICGGDGILVEKLLLAGIPVISIPILGRDISLVNDIRSFFFILETLHKHKPDVFHINSSKMGAIGTFAGRLMGTKNIIFTAHGWAFNENRSWWEKPIIKYGHWLTVLLSHATICVSDKLRRDISDWMIKNKLFVIHNGIWPFELVERDEARRELANGFPGLLVGNIAELHHIKAQDVLLRAWAEFIKNNHARLVLMGAGEERERLETLALKLGIASSVTFLGFVDEARRLLGGLDIFILPSYSEGLPYTILEAGYAGLPIIASGVGGIPEVIKDGHSGVLIKAGDPEIINTALQKLSSNEDTREMLGNNIKREILEDFSGDKMVDKTFEIYVRGKRA